MLRQPDEDEAPSGFCDYGNEEKKRSHKTLKFMCSNTVWGFCLLLWFKKKRLIQSIVTDL